MKAPTWVLNKEIALLGPSPGHCESSRRFVDSLLTTALRPRCAAPRRSRTCSPGRRCPAAPPAPPLPPCRCWRRGRRSPPWPPPAPPPPASPWCCSLTSHCRCHSILGSAHIAAYHSGWRDDGLLAPDHILFILLGMIIALLKCSLLKYTGSRWEKQLPGEIFTRFQYWELFEAAAAQLTTLITNANNL